MDIEDPARFAGVLIVVFISGIIAAAGGIGGGGIIVPILLVIGKYSFQKASILSICCVLGNYSSQVLINWSRHHPLIKQRPLIYWDAILILLPSILGGSNIGVILNKLLPETILDIIAMVVLLYAIYKTAIKAHAYYLHETDPTGNVKYQKFLLTGNTENNADSPLDNPIMAQSQSTTSLLFFPQSAANKTLDDRAESHFDNSHRSNRFHYIHTDSSSDHDDESLMGGRYSETSSRPDTYVTEETVLPHLSTNSSSPFPMIYPWTTIQFLGVTWLYYVTMFIIIQEVTDSTCSMTYFLLLGSIYPVLVVVVYFAMQFVIKKQQVEGQFAMAHGDLDFRKSYMLPPVSFGVGIMCSLLGIGGGELMGPLLLSYNLLPQVSTGTTSMMSFLTSANNIVHYAIMGKIDIRMGGLLFCIGLVAGLIGRRTALFVTVKYGRNSFLIFMLLLVLCASVAMLVAETLSKEIQWVPDAYC